MTLKALLSLRGFLFILNFLWHLDLQKPNIPAESSCVCAHFVLEFTGFMFFFFLIAYSIKILTEIYDVKSLLKQKIEREFNLFILIREQRDYIKD